MPVVLHQRTHHRGICLEAIPQSLGQVLDTILERCPLGRATTIKAPPPAKRDVRGVVGIATGDGTSLLPGGPDRLRHRTLQPDSFGRLAHCLYCRATSPPTPAIPATASLEHLAPNV